MLEPPVNVSIPWLIPASLKYNSASLVPVILIVVVCPSHIVVGFGVIVAVGKRLIVVAIVLLVTHVVIVSVTATVNVVAVIILFAVVDELLGVFRFVAGVHA